MEEKIPKTARETENTEREPQQRGEGEEYHGKHEEDDAGVDAENGGAEAPGKGTKGDARTDDEGKTEAAEEGDTTDPNKNDPQPETGKKSEIAPAQKSDTEPVNTERGTDFKERESAKKPDMNPPEVVEAGKQRREYLDGLTDEGIAEEIVKKIKEMREARRLDEILKQSSWTAWLKESVDYLGRTMEEEAEQ